MLSHIHPTYIKKSIKQKEMAKKPNRKTGKNLIRNYREGSQTAHIHVKRCLTFLIIIKIQNITTVRSNFIPNQLDKLKFLQ